MRVDPGCWKLWIGNRTWILKIHAKDFLVCRLLDSILGTGAMLLGPFHHLGVLQLLD